MRATKGFNVYNEKAPFDACTVAVLMMAQCWG